VAGPAHAAAHHAIDRTGQARAAADGQGAVEADARGDGVMHGLDQIGQADAAVHAQPEQTSQVRRLQRQRARLCRAGVHRSGIGLCHPATIAAAAGAAQGGD
jgi:hypothetical protein